MEKLYNRFNRPERIMLYNDEPTMCQQHFKEECDINNILAKYIKTGILDSIGPGVYADITEMGDYRESIELIARAQEMFIELPSHIRKEFDNDPAQYLDFVHNPENLERGIELGIFKNDLAVPNSSQKEAKNPDSNPNQNPS